jgi:hypothetical protein
MMKAMCRERHWMTIHEHLTCCPRLRSGRLRKDWWNVSDKRGLKQSALVLCASLHFRIGAVVEENLEETSKEVQEDGSVIGTVGGGSSVAATAAMDINDEEAIGRNWDMPWNDFSL